MTPGEFKEYVRTMQDYGVSKLQMNGVLIEMDQARVTPEKVLNPSDPQNAPLGSDPDPIAHRQEELASLMKLSDNELVDQLFPEEDQRQEA